MTETDGKARTDVNLLWATGDGIRVEGITLDGHARDLPGLTVGGLYYWGDHAVARDVRVVDIRGDFARDIEVFGVGTVGTGGGAIIEDCLVQGAPGTYVSAFSVGYRPLGSSTPVRRSHVTRCHAIGDRCHFAYGACHATTFRDSSSDGFNYGFYNDTDEVRDVLMHGCQLRPTYVHLVHLKREWAKARVRVEACSFDYLDPGNGAPFIGLGLIDRVRDPAVTPFADIQVSRCSFRAPREPWYAYSTDAGRMSGIIMVECSVPDRVLRNGAGPVMSRSITASGGQPVWG